MRGQYWQGNRRVWVWRRRRIGSAIVGSNKLQNREEREERRGEYGLEFYRFPADGMRERDYLLELESCPCGFGWLWKSYRAIV